MVYFTIACSFDCFAQSSIRIPKARSAYDRSQDFHTTLLKMALTAAANGRAVPEIIADYEMTQGRAITQLQKGQLIDVYWTVSTLAIEEKLRAIPVPTSKGLLGFRKFIIHKDNIGKFKQIKNLDDLKKYVACQGTHWPDTDIMTAAELPVITTPNFENIFRMVNAKRCDYFPRAYHDHRNEVLTRASIYKNLYAFDDILLHYPAAVYFFTNKKNEELANWIESGLMILAEQGKITKLMESHPLTAHTLPLNDESKTLLLEIKNPLFPDNVNKSNKLLWYTLSDFNL
ncbi:MAG: hypothetical protein ACSHW0_11800 [Thalassotalea sp.]